MKKSQQSLFIVLVTLCFMLTIFVFIDGMFFPSDNMGPEIDVESVKLKIENSGLLPQEAKYYKVISE